MKPLSANKVMKIGIEMSRLFPASWGVNWKYKRKGDKHYLNFVVYHKPTKIIREEQAIADAFMKKIGKKALKKHGFYYDQKKRFYYHLNGRKHTK